MGKWGKGLCLQEFTLAGKHPVPLIVRAPGVSQAGKECKRPVSLIDLYPTLLDLCGLPTSTLKNEKGRPLDGFSMKPYLKNPEKGKWKCPIMP